MCRPPRSRWWLGACGALVVLAGAHAEEPAGEPAVSFRKEIAPLLHRRCAACHNEENAKGHYRVDTFSRLLKAGVSEELPVQQGKPDDSELFKVLLEPDAETRMPQKADPLPENEIALIRRWIAQGATYDGGAHERPLVEMAREVMLRPAPLHYSRPMPVTAMAFSPDGSKIAISGYYEITIWNAASGELVQRVGGLPERITSLAWHTKRNRIAIAGGSPAQWGTVALIDPTKDYRVRILCDLPETALDVAFSPDGQQLAVAGGDRTIRLFDVDSGKQKRLFRQHADWVQTVAYNREGSHLVSVSRDRTVRVLDAAKGELDATYSGHETAVLRAGFYASATNILSLAAHARNIHRWEVGKPNDKPKLFSFPAEVEQFSASGQNLYVTTAADRTIQVLQLSDGQPLITLHGHRDAVQSFAMHPRNSQMFATGSFDGEILIWDLACGTWTSRFSTTP